MNFFKIFILVSIVLLLTLSVFADDPEFTFTHQEVWEDIHGPGHQLYHFEATLQSANPMPRFFDVPQVLGTRPGYEDKHPRKVVDNYGRAHVTWMSKFIQTGVWEIWYVMLDATTGAQLSNMVMVSLDDEMHSVYPAIAVDHEEVGDAIYSHIVWIDLREQISDIYYSKVKVSAGFADDMNPVDWAVSKIDGFHSGRAILTKTPGEFIEHPDIDIDTDGNLHVIWSDARDYPNNDGWEVYYQMQDAGTYTSPANPVVFIEDTLISLNDGLDSQCPVIAADAPKALENNEYRSNVYIAWQDRKDEADNGDNWEIWFQWIIPDTSSSIGFPYRNNPTMVTSAIDSTPTNFGNPYSDIHDDGYHSAKPDIDSDYGKNEFVGVHIVWMDIRPDDPWTPIESFPGPPPHPGQWEIYSMTLAVDRNNNDVRKMYEKRQSDMGFPGWTGSYKGAPNRDACSKNPRVIVEGTPVCHHEPGTHAPLHGITYITWHDSRDGQWDIYYTEICNLCNNPQTDERVTFNESSDMFPDIGLMISQDDSIPSSPDIKWQSDRNGDWDILNVCRKNDEWVRATIDGHGFNMWPTVTPDVPNPPALIYGLSMSLPDGRHWFIPQAKNGAGEYTTSTDTIWFNVTPPPPPVTIALADSYGCAGEIMLLEMFIEDVTDRGILSYTISVDSDTGIIIPLGVESTGTLTAQWGDPTTNIVDGEITIAGAGTEALAGGGTLIYIRYQVNDQAQENQTTDLTFTDVVFNEGEPPANAQDGNFTVITGYDIAGRISYYFNDNNVPNVSLNLDGYSTNTDNQGMFMFTSVSGADYSLQPSHQGNLGNSISAFDASLVLRNVAGLVPVTPYQMVAADVSGNGSVSAFDASYILRHVVGLITEFPIAKDWTFIPSDFVIDENNWSSAPDSIVYAPLASNQVDQNFEGIIFGDVSGNWQAAGLNHVSTPKANMGSAVAKWGDMKTLKDDQFIIPLEIELTGELYAADLKIDFDSEVFEINKVTPGKSLADCQMEYRINNDELVIAIAGAEPIQAKDNFLEIQFSVKDRSTNRDAQIELEQASFNEGQINVTISGAQFNLNPSVPSKTQLLPNYPNPFNPETEIRFQIAEPSHVLIKIYSILGKEISTLVNSRYEPGFYDVIWNGKDKYGKALTSGVYIYKLEADNITQAKKMTLIR